jgi:septal ring factor EnvC (AmiA/AmiB activator)
MNLPEFIESALGFFKRAETHLTAEQQLAQLRGELATLQTQAAAEKTRADGLTGRLEAAETALRETREKLTAAEKTMADPAGAIATQASLKAAEITAGQGQPALPIKPDGGAAAETTLRERILALPPGDKRHAEMLKHWQKL